MESLSIGGDLVAVCSGNLGDQLVGPEYTQYPRFFRHPFLFFRFVPSFSPVQDLGDSRFRNP